MPPRKREDKEAAELCSTCFPDGWPADATTAGCEHGNWARTAPAPASDDE